MSTQWSMNLYCRYSNNMVVLKYIKLFGHWRGMYIRMREMVLLRFLVRESTLLQIALTELDDNPLTNCNTLTDIPSASFQVTQLSTKHTVLSSLFDIFTLYPRKLTASSRCIPIFKRSMRFLDLLNTKKNIWNMIYDIWNIWFLKWCTIYHCISGFQ